MEVEIAELMASPDIKNVILGCELALATPPMLLDYRQIFNVFIEEIVWKFCTNMEISDTGIFTIHSTEDSDWGNEDKVALYNILYISVGVDHIKVSDVSYQGDEENVGYDSISYVEWEHNTSADLVIKLGCVTPLIYYKFIIEKILDYARKRHEKGNTMPPADTEAPAWTKSKNPERERLVGLDPSTGIWTPGTGMFSLWNAQTKS